MCGALSVGSGAGVVGSQWLLPKLKQLPERRLSAEAVQQRLLAQHSTLAERITGAPGTLVLQAFHTFQG